MPDVGLGRKRYRIPESDGVKILKRGFQNDNSYAADLNTHVYAKPWDYGVHFRLGYSLFFRYSLLLELQQGIANLQPKWGDYKPKNTIRNRSFGVSLAYRL